MKKRTTSTGSIRAAETCFHQEVLGFLKEISERQVKLERKLDSLKEREFYTVEELAQKLGKSKSTVRKWVEGRRVNISKRRDRYGLHSRNAVSHTEFVRYQREGLLPPGEGKIVNA